MKHDLLVTRLQRAALAVALHDAGRSFIASLGSASKRHRRALSHLAYATNMPAHGFTASSGEQDYLCAICGASADEDVDVTEIEDGLARGDAVTASPGSALVDLEGYAKLEPVKPTDEDLARFDAMLDVLAKLPPTGRATDLVKKWSPLMPRSNTYARAALIETLGACGILETPDHPGHLTRWVGFWEYEEVPSTTGDGRPPEAWWSRADGVNRAALDLVFPDRALDRSRFPKARAKRRPITKDAVRIPKKGANPGLELRPGDLVGIEYRARWVAGVVLGAHVEGKSTLPVIELFDGSFAARPEPRALAKRSARVVGPYREGPRWRREPLALEQLELFGAVMPVRLERLATGHGPPPGDEPVASFRVVAARNLLYLLTALIAGSPR